MDIDSLETVMADHCASPARDMATTLQRLGSLLPTYADPTTEADLLDLLRMLHAVARHDLPLARLFEGHVDALQIIERYAEHDLAIEARAIARAGGLFGVWNAALAGEPLRLIDGALHGAKSFASGAGILTHVVAGVDTDKGNRLVLIDMTASRPHIDRTYWQVVGMNRSESHVVRWAGADRDSFRFVGQPGDYAREPYFSGGALRFVACHAGGVAALFDHVRAHLVALGRSDDPHQAGRLAEVYLAAESAAAAVRTAAGVWGQRGFEDHVAAARMNVTQCAERAIMIAQTAVGLGGMFDAHPLSAALTDLMVYLRQPMPDANRMRVAKAAATGVLRPGI